MSERMPYIREFRSGLIGSFVQCAPEGRVHGAAFSLGTFFVAVDKESTSPVGARTHMGKPFSYTEK